MRSSMRPSVRRREVKMGEDVVKRGVWLEMVLPMLSKFEAGARLTRDTLRWTSPEFDVT